MQRFNRQEVAEAVVLAKRDAFYCCGLVIGREQIRNYKENEEKNFVNSCVSKLLP